MSADERRKDRLDFLIHDHFGEVAAEVTKEELVGKGTLCEVRINVVPTDYDFPAYLRCLGCRTQILNLPSNAKKLRACRCKQLQLERNGTIKGDYLPIPYSDVPPEDRGEVMTRLYTRAIDYMEDDEERNLLVRRIASVEHRKGASVLLFCNRVKQARALCRAIAVEDEVPCGLMLGGGENKETFADTRKRLRSGDLRCAVGSSAVYQGEDIPRLSVGIVVTPTGSNKQQIEQQIGRLRRKFPGKVFGRLYYVWDHHLFPGHHQNLRRWYGRHLVRVVDPGEI